MPAWVSAHFPRSVLKAINIPRCSDDALPPTEGGSQAGLKGRCPTQSGFREEGTTLKKELGACQELLDACGLCGLKELYFSTFCCCWQGWFLATCLQNWPYLPSPCAQDAGPSKRRKSQSISPALEPGLVTCFGQSECSSSVAM